MSPEGPLVLSCGVLATEVLGVMGRNGPAHITVELPRTNLQNAPSETPDAAAKRRSKGSFDRVLVGYGDCGTGGALDAIVEGCGAERLPGSLCYEFLSNSDVFATIHDDNPKTFYLTDFLIHRFERLVWSGPKLDRRPELLVDYFGSYERVAYLSQLTSPDMVTAARRCADILRLSFEHEYVGLGDLETAMLALPSPAPAKAFA